MIDRNQITLRTASAADEGFLVQLRRVTMYQVVTNHFLWDDEAQHQRVMLNYESARVIRMGNLEIGLFKVVYSASEVHLSQIQLMPKYQGMGIGTKLISVLQTGCTQTKMPITLHVFRSNPALRLYLKLGFNITSSDADGHMMQWSPFQRS